MLITRALTLYVPIATYDKLTPLLDSKIDSKIFFVT
jgi:hypothetical protein